MKSETTRTNGLAAMLTDVKIFYPYKITTKLSGIDCPITHTYFLKDITAHHLYVFEHDTFKTLTYTAQEVLEKLRDGTLKRAKGGLT